MKIKIYKLKYSFIKSWLILSAILSLDPDTAFGQNVQKIDSILKAYSYNDLLTGSYLVARSGKIILSKGYNYADRENKIVNSPSTTFRLASLSKTITATAILLLEQRGKLAVTDQLSKYIPGYPKGDSITIHHLLTHRSGIIDAYKLPFFTDSVLCNPISMNTLINTFRNTALEFSPGEKFKYSNSGYILLAYIIEKVGGLSYGKFIQKNVFDPLGMKNSGYQFDLAKPASRSVGYTVRDETMKALIPHESVGPGTSSLYSSTEDMFKFCQALFSEKLISKTSLSNMITPASKDGYAYGWFTGTKNGHKALWHQGGIFGYSTFMHYYPDDSLFIIGLRNCDRYAMLNEEDVLPKILFNQSVELPKIYQEKNISGEQLKRYTGEYEIAPKVKIKISEDKGKLFVTGPDGSSFSLFFAGNDLFFLKVMDVQCEFRKDEKNKINALYWIQKGRKTEAKITEQ